MFTFQGRLSRQDFWTALVGAVILTFGVVILLAGMLALLVPDKLRQYLEIPFYVLLAVVGLVDVWVLTVVQVKRWHDLDLSGLWITTTLACIVAFIAIAYADLSQTPRALLNLIPLAGLCGVFGALGFITGTRGPNRHGPDSVSLSTLKRFDLARPFTTAGFTVPAPTLVPIVDKKFAHLAPPAAAPSPTMVRCLQCGAAATDSARFCGQCGAPLHLGTALQPADDMPEGLTLVDDDRTPRPTDVKIEQAPDWVVERFPTSDTSLLGSSMMGYRGRISRQEFWLIYVVMLIAILGVYLFGSIFINFARTSDTVRFIEFFSIIVAFWLNALEIWIMSMATIKRLHDLDLSGWWALLVLIPIFGPLGMLIVAGFIRGTKGPNRFGNDPIAVRKVY